MKEKEWDEMLAVQRAAYLKSSRDSRFASAAPARGRPLHAAVRQIHCWYVTVETLPDRSPSGVERH
jgi:hypothetical protein